VGGTEYLYLDAVETTAEGFFAERLNRSRSTPSFRASGPFFGVETPAPRIKEVDPRGFSATAISCVENQAQIPGKTPQS